MINKIVLENYEYYFHPTYTAYAGSLDGYDVHADAAQKPTLGTPNENGYMKMSTENDWHWIFVHDFIWKCFHGPLKYGDEVLHINGNHKDNRLADLKLNAIESRIIIKVTGNCSISSYVWFFNNQFYFVVISGFYCNCESITLKYFYFGLNVNL